MNEPHFVTTERVVVRLLGGVVLTGPKWITGEAPTFPRIVSTTCSACAGCGFYLDYAGPGICGGVAVPCTKCDGTGWVA